MEYRLQGRTFFDIGKALGVTPGRAHQLVDEALEATLQEPAAHLRALALARLEAVMTGVFGKAVNGDTKAVTIVLKIIDVVIDISQGIDHGGVYAFVSTPFAPWRRAGGSDGSPRATFPPKRALPSRSLPLCCATPQCGEPNSHYRDSFLFG